MFDGAGHFPDCDRPERFTELLVDFLDHTEPARRSTGEQAASMAAHAVLDPPDRDDPAHPAARAGGRPNDRVVVPEPGQRRQHGEATVAEVRRAPDSRGVD